MRHSCARQWPAPRCVAGSAQPAGRAAAALAGGSGAPQPRRRGPHPSATPPLPPQSGKGVGGFRLFWESDGWDSKIVAMPYISNKQVTIPPIQQCPSGDCQPVGTPSPSPSPPPPAASSPPPPSPLVGSPPPTTPVPSPPPPAVQPQLDISCRAGRFALGGLCELWWVARAAA